MDWGTHHMADWFNTPHQQQYLLDILACVASSMPQSVDCWRLRLSHASSALFARMPASFVERPTDNLVRYDLKPLERMQCLPTTQPLSRLSLHQ
jgi:hypothetical protein